MNEAGEVNELINHVSIAFIITGKRTLTTEEKNSGFIWLLTGSPGAGFALTIPDSDRVFGISSNSGQTATLETVGVSTLEPTVADSEVKLIRLDGGELAELSTGGGDGSSSFTKLTDTPGSNGGNTSNFVAVNGGATALEFVATQAAAAGVGGAWEFLELQDASGENEVVLDLHTGYLGVQVLFAGPVGTDLAGLNLEVSTDRGSN